MKLYYYRGLEHAPLDVTHVIVDDSVTAIKDDAFYHGEDGNSNLVSVIMGDNVRRIGSCAFKVCCSLKFVRISKNLEHIGQRAFFNCYSLEVLILRPTVKSIGDFAFYLCSSLRVLILSEVKIIGYGVVDFANAFRQIAYDIGGVPLIARSPEVRPWLIHHMDKFPLHKLCYRTDISAEKINDYLNVHGSHSADYQDNIHGMTPLHMLAANPHAPADTLAGSLLHANMDAVYVLDNSGNTPLDYAREYNVPGMLKLIEALCMNPPTQNRRNCRVCRCPKISHFFPLLRWYDGTKWILQQMMIRPVFRVLRKRTRKKEHLD
eukprot:233627_1